MKISNTIEIKSKPEKVFYWLEDPCRAMKWMTSVTRTEIIKETPNIIGTTFREYIEEDNRGTEMNGIVTDFISNKRLTFHLEGDCNTAKIDFNLEEKDGITQLTQNVELQFKGFLRILTIFLGTFLKKKIERQAQSEFVRLKELCEQNVQY
jgi:carbon monoxide dehydrogenase subunit G